MGDLTGSVHTGIRASRAVNLDGFVSNLGNRFLVTLDQQSEYSRELGGITVADSDTTFHYDAFANVVERFTDHNDGFTERVTTSFVNDPINWLIGLPVSTFPERTAPNHPASTRSISRAFDAATGSLVQTIEDWDEGTVIARGRASGNERAAQLAAEDAMLEAAEAQVRAVREVLGR